MTTGEVDLDLLKKCLTEMQAVNKRRRYESKQANILRGPIARFHRGPAVTVFPLIHLKHLESCMAGGLDYGVVSDFGGKRIWPREAVDFTHGIDSGSIQTAMAYLLGSNPAI